MFVTISMHFEGFFGSKPIVLDLQIPATVFKTIHVEGHRIFRRMAYTHSDDLTTSFTFPIFSGQEDKFLSRLAKNASACILMRGANRHSEER